jgi:putative transposase
MARAYSEDLREKVISHIISGCSKREAARIFKVGEATLYRWQKLYEAGSLKPKKRTEYPHKVDENKLRSYMKQNPDHTLEQISQALNLGVKTVFTWLNRLNITRKKRQHSIKSVTKRNEANLKSSLRK